MIRLIVFCDSYRQFRNFLDRYPALKPFRSRVIYAPDWNQWRGLDPKQTLGICTGTLMNDRARGSEREWVRRAVQRGDPTGAIIWMPTQ